VIYQPPTTEHAYRRRSSAAHPVSILNIDHQAGLLKTLGTGQQRDAGTAATPTVAVARPPRNPLYWLGRVATRSG
jgi:hypothetical protein